MKNKRWDFKSFILLDKILYHFTRFFQLADEIFDAMVRKFRSQSDEVWHLQAENLMNTSRQAKARDLLKRALDSVPKARRKIFFCKISTHTDL